MKDSLEPKEQLLRKLYEISNGLEKLETAIDAAFYGLSSELISEKFGQLETMDENLIQFEQMMKTISKEENRLSAGEGLPNGKLEFGF